MRYEKVLLICPPSLRGKIRLSHFPHVGLGYIAEALIKSGVHVSVLDMNAGYRFNDLQYRIREFSPTLIGFTGMTLGYNHFYRMINKIKSLYPQINIIVGGAHCSSVREQFLQECQGVDYGIIFEGDKTIVQLCCGEELEKIQGFIYRINGEVVSNQFKNFIRDLDSLSFPRYESFELGKYPSKSIAIVTSRGCPYDCIYCSVGASAGKEFRARSAEDVVNEIEYWYNRGYREIFILDDNFTFVRKRVEKICELLLKMDFKGLSLKNPVGLRADRVDRELLKKLKHAGFDLIAFGVESASNRILDNIKKGETIFSIEQAVKNACELGFDVDLFFLIGSPGETMQDLQKSFLLAKKYLIRRADFYNLVPFPSTELLDMLVEKRYLVYSLNEIFNDISYYQNKPCFYTPEMSIIERRKAFNLGKKISIEVQKRFMEGKIRAPLILKRIIVAISTAPLIEKVTVNSRWMLRLRRLLKRFLFR